ncbi:MAG: hypothetical protein ACYDIC_00865 [Desulfobaccales bacterium]
MKIKHLFPLRKVGAGRFLSRITAPALCGVLALWLLAACAPRELPPTPRPVYPSRVVTQDGLAYTVQRLKLPGTRQELTVRNGGAKQWLPLNLLQGVRFTAPFEAGYRQADIFLISGDRLQGEVYVVNVILEGSTDLGYWNMPLSKVERLDLGRD